jgi:hypothetical protein
MYIRAAPAVPMRSGFEELLRIFNVKYSYSQYSTPEFPQEQQAIPSGTSLATENARRRSHWALRERISEQVKCMQFLGCTRLGFAHFLESADTARKSARDFWLHDQKETRIGPAHRPSRRGTSGVTDALS